MDNLAVATLPPNPANGTMASYGSDKTIMATFSEEVIKNEYKSNEQGRPIYDSFVQIELQYPGDNTKNFKKTFTMEDGDKGNIWTQRFPRQWAAFKSQHEQVPDGRPVETWAVLDKKRTMELKGMGYHTIEQVAAMTDMNGPKMGLDWRKLRDQAIATMKPEDGAVAISKLTQENEDLKNRLDTMEKQMQNLATLSSKSTDAEKVTLSLKNKT